MFAPIPASSIYALTPWWSTCTTERQNQRESGQLASLTENSRQSNLSSYHHQPLGINRSPS